MLHAYIKKLCLGSIAFMLPLMGMASALTDVHSTYQYVPQGVMPAVSYQGKKQAKAYSQALTDIQRVGVKTGHHLANRMQSQIDHLNHHSVNWKMAKRLTVQQGHIVNEAYQKAAEEFHIKGFKGQDSNLYYFISFSMPKILIKEYMLDAIWNGGVLVLRGVERGMSLSLFIKKYLMPLASYKGNHAKIEIDPNLFEMYDITKVPTFVVSKSPSDRMGCQIILTPVPGTHIPYQRCTSINSNLYWKLSGSVTSRWALKKLIASGAPAQIFLSRMKALNQKESKVAKGFKGDWKSAPMPFAESTISQVLTEYGKGQTRNGAIGAVALINAMSKREGGTP